MLMPAMIKMSLVAALLLAGLTVGAQGQVGGGGFSGYQSWLGAGGSGGIQLRGHVVCARCSLEEARAAQRGRQDLYQLLHEQGQVVLLVRWVSNPHTWRQIVWPPRLVVRGEARLFEQLTAEENLGKEVEISGVLTNLRVLDLAGVSVGG